MVYSIADNGIVAWIAQLMLGLVVDVAVHLWRGCVGIVMVHTISILNFC